LRLISQDKTWALFVWCRYSRKQEGNFICYADGPQLATKPSNFWEVLCKWQCTWMWDNLQWVGDDDWIATVIAKGTCMAVTDGLYMRDLYPHRQSAAVILECTKGRGRVWCSFPEAS
jgi:hypothetical protein